MSAANEHRAGHRDLEILDVRYGGRPEMVGAWLSGDVLIDCGPTACVEDLLTALAGRRPRRLLLTHIHFDHAGAAGALVRLWPDLEVFVHPRGAPHLIDPSRLVASARRVFGDRFEGLVGDVVPVPEENLKVIEDGERIGRFSSAWTPGHAWHHVAFLDRDSGVAFPGDVAGVRLAPGVVVPPTPPPDIDLRCWRASLGVLEAWEPTRLALPHFGPVEDPPAHMAEMREALDRHEGWAREGEDVFVARLTEHLRARMPEKAAEGYSFITLARPSAAGLRRWLEQEQDAAAPFPASGPGAG
jgi:glyoxylase-like metal-dependent hydrolase (beta-lactamase superfamily II)